ncbi:hypothetical protein niasHT_006134 [Heterodera trifolii]|uniref:Uncharacterized protein n=1 Tax=Heterodera trifolii TaxID=157864 RepID=A0ABD2M338_9BILA
MYANFLVICRAASSSSSSSSFPAHRLRHRLLLLLIVPIVMLLVAVDVAHGMGCVPSKPKALADMTIKDDYWGDCANHCSKYNNDLDNCDPSRNIVNFGVKQCRCRIYGNECVPKKMYEDKNLREDIDHY